MICVSSAKAIDVDLSRFPSSAVAARDEKTSFEVALRAHLQRFGQSTNAFDNTDESIAFGQNAPSCLGSGYLQTWWLPTEVEKRRATYFEAMSEIACENKLPVSLLDAVVAKESG